jgi:hypothetical protein
VVKFKQLVNCITGWFAVGCHKEKMSARWNGNSVIRYDVLTERDVTKSVLRCHFGATVIERVSEVFTADFGKAVKKGLKWSDSPSVNFNSSKEVNWIPSRSPSLLHLLGGSDPRSPSVRIVHNKGCARCSNNNHFMLQI